MNESSKQSNSYLLILSLGALGIVFGDIGTSPLYAFRECFSSHYGLAISEANVFGVLSLIIWSLLLVVLVKYTIYIMAADNNGEGGVLALMVLAQPPTSLSSMARRTGIVLLGVFGAALIYGDGIITPAISVLSAVEGLTVYQPDWQPWVLPLTAAIIICLYVVQSSGTSKLGKVFGPIVLVWFLTLGTFGALSINKYPSVFFAFNPYLAIEFLATNGKQGFLVLGSVFLVVTGAEALYADMGHFGKLPIRLAWSFVTLPCLLLNYLGQAALVLNDHSTASNPFFLLAPDSMRLPLVALATVATVIASQAMISGTFSLTRQAMLLGFIPRLDIQHTSEQEKGQIYLPFVNYTMLIGTLILVYSFKSSSNLASAYGIAVVTTMLISSILMFFVMRNKWKWSLFSSLMTTLFFVSIDLLFFGANIIKVFQGGWVPLAIALFLVWIMLTWRSGRLKLSKKIRSMTQPLEQFLKQCEVLPRVAGTGVFMTQNIDRAPNAMVHNVRHNKCLHQRILLVTVFTEEEPHVDVARRVEVTPLGSEFYRVVVRFGYMDMVDVAKTLLEAEALNPRLEIDQSTFFFGRETLVVGEAQSGLERFQAGVFSFLSRNSQRATAFFSIPSTQVVEIGVQIEV